MEEEASGRLLQAPVGKSSGGIWEAPVGPPLGAAGCAGRVTRADGAHLAGGSAAAPRQRPRDQLGEILRTRLSRQNPFSVNTVWGMIPA